MDFLKTVEAFFLVLGPLVFVHEVGHFIIGKLTGVHIEEFGLGFPPRLVRLWRGMGRLWIANAEVKIPGRLRLPDVLAEGVHATLIARRQTDGRLALQTLEVLKPEQVPPPSGPVGADEVRLNGQITRLERGTEYTLNVIPLGGFVRPKGEDDPSVPGGLASATKRVRLAVLVAGAAMNIVAAFALLSLAYMYGAPQDTPVAVSISKVAADSPAAQAGLQSGDVMESINGQKIVEIGTLRDAVDEQVRSHPGEPLTMVVTRNGQSLTLSLVPRVNPPQGQGSMGVEIQQEVDTQLVHYGPIEAMQRGAAGVMRAVGLFFEVPAMVIRGALPLEAMRPVSMVGISQIGASVIRRSQDIGQWWPYLEFTAFVSIALAISNLLPLPALDGGRILFVLIEAVRGRRISPERETAIHFVGMALLLMVMLVLIVQDILVPPSLGG